MSSLTVRKFSFQNFNWITGGFIIAYHLLLLIALPIYFLYHTPPLGVLIATGILIFFGGISITAGYHRLFSHSAYKTNPIIEAILLFFGTMATQGSLIRWAYEHRIHHAFVDKDEDPYCIKKGFWYAHVFWLLFKGRDVEKKVVADLYRNKLAVFQDKYYVVLLLITNLLPTLFVGYLYNDYLSAFLFAWGVRLFLSHHFTWFINSLAHYWGRQSFSQEHTAVDNYIISLVTWGEGYHNYHHTFANDYRNGIRWYHFDPTKWLIYGLHKLGLAHNLRRISAEKIAKQMVLERRGQLLDKIASLYQEKKQLLEAQIDSLSDQLIAKISDFYTLLEEKKSSKQETSENFYREMKEKIELMKLDLNKTWKEWKRLSRSILKSSEFEIVS